jgi:hypothetical protein
VPATYPSHAAAVLPLWLWRPRWFDLVALVVGSTTPDLAYALRGVSLIESHALPAEIWWCLPVGLACTLALRGTLATIAAHLPRAGALELRDYGVLGRHRPHWTVTVISVLLGSFSHIAWDSFTHPYGLMVHRLLFLATPSPLGLPWWHAAQFASTALGALAAVLMTLHIGHRRILIRSYGEPPEVTIDLTAFWSAATLAFALGVLSIAMLLHVGGLLALAVRSLLVVVGALMVGAVTVRLLNRSSTVTA